MEARSEVGFLTEVKGVMAMIGGAAVNVA